MERSKGGSMTFSPRRALLVAAAIAVLPACGPATHGDADVATPAAAAPMQGDTSGASTGATPAPPQADAITDSLMASEHDIWDAWMKHDADRIAVLSTDDMSIVNISGQEIYATTVYVKDGDAWKWAFGFNSPS